MPEEKEPGMDVEEAKARLRIEEVEPEAAACPKCAEVRRAAGDPTAYCTAHLERIYGI